MFSRGHPRSFPKKDGPTHFTLQILHVSYDKVPKCTTVLPWCFGHDPEDHFCKRYYIHYVIAAYIHISVYFFDLVHLCDAKALYIFREHEVNNH